MARHVLSIGYDTAFAPKLDSVAEMILGRPCESCGGGVSSAYRNMEFVFETDEALEKAKTRVRQDGRFKVLSTYVQG